MHISPLLVGSWAAHQSAIRAILMVGSRARRDQPADAWADLDLMVFCAEFHPFLSTTDWLAELGPVWLVLPVLDDPNEPTFLTLYEGGEKVDFHLFGMADLQHMVTTQTLPDVYQRGYAILIDKDHTAAQLPPPSFRARPTEPPALAAFLQTIHAFWYGALYVAKQICRRNLWVVKFRDWGMKEYLLRMIEWHAQATHGQAYDTWHDGHWLANWTDSQTWAEVHSAFGGFDAMQSWQALFATTGLFRRLATATAAHYGYAYPDRLDEQITRLLAELRGEDTGP